MVTVWVINTFLSPCEGWESVVTSRGVRQGGCFIRFVISGLKWGINQLELTQCRHRRVAPLTASFLRLFCSRNCDVILARSLKQFAQMLPMWLTRLSLRCVWRRLCCGAVGIFEFYLQLSRSKHHHQQNLHFLEQITEILSDICFFTNCSSSNRNFVALFP